MCEVDDVKTILAEKKFYSGNWKLEERIEDIGGEKEDAEDYEWGDSPHYKWVYAGREEEDEEYDDDEYDGGERIVDHVLRLRGEKIRQILKEDVQTIDIPEDAEFGYGRVQYHDPWRPGCKYLCEYEDRFFLYTNWPVLEDLWERDKIKPEYTMAFYLKDIQENVEEREHWYADKAEELEEESKELYEEVRRYIKTPSEDLFEWNGDVLELELIDGATVNVNTVAADYWECCGSIEIDDEIVEEPDFTEECDDLHDLYRELNCAVYEEEYGKELKFNLYDKTAVEKMLGEGDYESAYYIVGAYIAGRYLVKTLKHIRDYVEEYADFYNKLAEEGEENANTNS